VFAIVDGLGIVRAGDFAHTGRGTMMTSGDRRAIALVCQLCLAALSCSPDRRVMDAASLVEPGTPGETPPSAADIEPAPADFGSSSATAATLATPRWRTPGPVLPGRPTSTSTEPAPDMPSMLRAVEVPSVSPPILLGTLAGPDMPHVQPNLKLYGTDMGLSFEHDGKLVMLFGDTWPSSDHICEGEKIVNDDTIAYLPLDYPGGIPELRYLTRTDSPNDLRYIHVYRGEESLQLGYGQAPVAGFSDGERSYGLFERMEPHACGASYATGSQACPTDDHFECSPNLGLCDPPIIPFPAPCEIGNDDSCLPTQTCKPATLCVDPTSSQYADGHYWGEERSVAHTLEIAVAHEDAPDQYDSLLAFPTSKFQIPAARTVAKFSGAKAGNDYAPGHDRLLVWGRPGLTAEHERDGYLYLMTHRLPLETGADGRLKFEPQYFAGTDPKTGEPVWSSHQSEATGIALDGHVNGDPHESVQVLMNMTISWLGAPIDKWVLMYGGDLADWLLLDGDVSRGARTPGAVWMRFADHPWGPFSPPQPHLVPGNPLRINDPVGPGGYLYDATCKDTGTTRCATSDPHRPLDGVIGCPFRSEDPGRLYAPNVIDQYTHPNANGGLDVVWNVSTWNPYAVKLFRTSIQPVGSGMPQQDELADPNALRRLSDWRRLPELGEVHHYTQQTSYDRGTTDTSYPLSNHGNRDFNNFVCKSRNADVSARQQTPFKYDLPDCPESYVRGVVVSRFEGSGHMVRMWMGMQSLLAGPADDEVLRIYVDDEPRPRVDVPLAQAFDGRAGEIFAPPFGAGSPSRLAWYYPVSFRKKLIVAIDRLGDYDAIYYHCDVVSDDPSGDPLPSGRLPERELAQQQLAAVFRPAGTLQLLLDEPVAVTLSSGGLRELSLAGPATIHELKVRVKDSAVALLMQVRARLTWDGASAPAIDVSLADLLGGSVPPENSSLALTSLVEADERILALKLPMPFRTGAKLSFENVGEAAIAFELRVSGERAVPEEKFGYLHVSRSETDGPTREAQRVAVSASGRGRLVGLCNEVQGHADPAAGIQYDQLNMLEGDLRGMIDGKLALNGTGSEETADDVFYFLDAPYANAFAQTWGIQNDRNRPPGRASFCSWHVLGRELDFQKSLELTFELGGAGNPSIVERYKSVAYLYLDEPGT
jgi:hypothetical protein